MFFKRKLKSDENFRKVMGSVEGDSLELFYRPKKNLFIQILTLKKLMGKRGLKIN